MVVDLVIPEDGETLKEAHDKWRRWAEAKVRILRSNILHGETLKGNAISRKMCRGQWEKSKVKDILGDTQGEALKGRRLAEAKLKIYGGQIYYFLKV
jgi:hypothetical protein